MTAINLGMPAHPDDHWSRAAACLGYDPDRWFPSEGSVARFIAEQSKDICINDCPVRLECLRDNIDVEFGIFGGLDEKERKALRK